LIRTGNHKIGGRGKILGKVQARTFLTERKLARHLRRGRKKHCKAERIPPSPLSGDKKRKNSLPIKKGAAGKKGDFRRGVLLSLSTTKKL